MEQQKDLGWCVYGITLHRPQDFGRVIEADEQTAIIKPSENSPVEYWDRDYVKLFHSLESAVGEYVRLLPQVDSPLCKREMPEDVWRRAKYNFPEYFVRKDLVQVLANLLHVKRKAIST